jgi:hypothetical protein
VTGPLALAGGAEFEPGNWEQDRILAEAAGGRPAYVVCSAIPTFGERWIPSAQRVLGEGVPLVGVDERTAAVWGGGSWSVAGPGKVTVVSGGHRSRFASGELITGIPLPAAP